MNKRLLVLLVLIVVLFGAVYFAADGIDRSKTDLSFRLETVYGDPHAADGLVIDCMPTIRFSEYGPCKDLWESRILIEDAKATATTVFTSDVPYNYSNGIYPNTLYEARKKGISAVFDVSDPGLLSLNEDLMAITKARSEFDWDGPVYSFLLSDYFEYYPLDIYVDLPEGFNISREDVKDLLRIPVPKDLRLSFYYYGDPLDGNERITWNNIYNINSRDVFRIQVQGGMAGGSYYFTLPNVVDDGSLADMSHIPAGYGIYRAAEGGSIELWKALPKDTAVLGFCTDEKGGRLYLYTMEEGWCKVSILDEKTGAVVKKMNVLKYSKARDYILKLFAGSGSSVLALCNTGLSSYWLAEEVYIVTEDEVIPMGNRAYDFKNDSGEYTVYPMRGSGVFSAASRGGRILIVSRELNYFKREGERVEDSYYGTQPCGGMICIIGRGGLDYMGVLSSSLDDPYHSKVALAGGFENHHLVSYYVQAVKSSDATFLSW